MSAWDEEKKKKGLKRLGGSARQRYDTLLCVFQPLHYSDVTRGQSSVYFLWVRVRVSSIHCEKHNNVGHPREESTSAWDEEKKKKVEYGHMLPAIIVHTVEVLRFSSEGSASLSRALVCLLRHTLIRR